MLELRGIKAGYGRHVLRDVSLTVQPGTVAAVLGPNGAGKTTLLRVASGLPQTLGRVSPAGRTGDHASPAVRPRPARAVSYPRGPASTRR